MEILFILIVLSPILIWIIAYIVNDDILNKK